jgi:L-ascorbate metabolism protein UlaG (beta-lactamase superfamily)
MKLIGDSTKLLFAALPIGDNYTMGMDDAVQAAEFVRCNEVLALHCNTFPPIKGDTREDAKKFKAAGKKLHSLSPGESHDFQSHRIGTRLDPGQRVGLRRPV